MGGLRRVQKKEDESCRMSRSIDEKRAEDGLTRAVALNAANAQPRILDRAKLASCARRHGQERVVEA